MATYTEISDTVVGIARDLSDVAENSYGIARQALDGLAGAATDLPLTIVDTTIGADASISWTATITPVTPSDAPTFLETYIAGLPATAPTVPDASVDLTELTATPPTITANETPGAPDGIGTLTYEAMPTIGTLPTIDPVIPTISQTALDAAFNWTDLTYTPEIKDETKAELLRVLGGDLGLSASYWEALWAQASGDLAQQMLGKLRTSRNRGAASYWALPGETTLAAARQISDETTKATQLVRLQQATQAAVMAREDFWQAVSNGLKFEELWIGLYTGMAQRALAAAETLVNLQIQAHNANVAYYNLLFEGAKIETQIGEIQTNAVLRTYEAQLKGSEVNLQQVKARIEKYQAEWAAKNTREKTLVEVFGESVRAWGTQVDSEIKVAKFPLEKAEIEARVHATLFGAVGALASATSAIVQSEAANSRMVLDGELALLDLDKAKNMVEVELTKLTQAAQEAKARIDVAQAEWINGQANELTKRIAELAYGYAQAAVAAADVGLSSSTNIGLSKSEAASHNAEIVWGTGSI